MSRKRDKPYNSRHNQYSYPKRRRPLPPPPCPPVEEPPKEKPAPPPAVVVIGLPEGCSILDLKSRFEIYGAISRIRIDQQGVGFITFRSKFAADSALSASLDPSFGISIDSHRVQVMWPSEMNGEAGIREDNEINTLNSSPNANTSKLLKGEAPLRRHGRGSRLSSAIVNPNISSSTSSVLDAPLKAREIIAYDDIF